jgi:hypothetical protein
MTSAGHAPLPVRMGMARVDSNSIPTDNPSAASRRCVIEGLNDPNNPNLEDDP